MEKGWIDRRKNMEKKRQKKKIFCIIDLLQLIVINSK